MTETQKRPKIALVTNPMNLQKIDTTLALAISQSDGPMTIVAKLTDGSILIASLTKDKIDDLSEKDEVVEIKLGTRVRNRRKSERPGHKDRRWDNG